MSSFSFLLIMILCWGVGGVLVRKGFAKLTPWQTYAVDAFLIALPLWLFYGYITRSSIKPVTPIALFAAGFMSAFYALYYYTIEKGPIGITSPLISTYPLFTVPLALIFLHERLNSYAIAGIILTCLGITVISITRTRGKMLEKFVYLSILVAIGYGVGAFLGKIAVDQVGNSTYLVILAIAQILVVACWRLFRDDPIPKINIKTIGHSFVGIFLFNIGNIAFYIALERGLSSIVVPLSNTYVIITVILSAIYLKEHIKWYKYIGIALTIVGVLIVNISQSRAPESNKFDLAEPVKISLIPTPTFARLKARVSYVQDGDTFDLENGKRVRLIGLNAAEDNRYHPIGCYAVEAKKMLTALVQNQEVELESDVQDLDKYNRQLRYVYLDGVFINQFLVEQGAAKALPIPPDTRYAVQFLNAQTDAQLHNRGLWNTCR